MNRHWLILVLSVVLLSCSSIEQEGERLQRDLNKQTARAETLSEQMSQYVSLSSLDSLRMVCEQNEDILFYLFSSSRMVFWSNNWLAGKSVSLNKYKHWEYVRFDNAQCVCYWSRVGNYNLLTVVPLRTDYALPNSQLHNGFVEPFRVSDKYVIEPLYAEGAYKIYSSSGDYLFSLALSTEQTNSTATAPLRDSFSYHSLMSDDQASDDLSATPVRLQVFMWLTLGIFVIVVCVGVIGLIRNRGFRHMRFRTKLLYVFVILQMFSYVYFFISSINHVRERYEIRQRKDLQQRTAYIQKTLQDMYYWNVSLNESSASNLSIDLRDLSYTYQTDIHVYDMNGDLVGSSASALFDNGLCSRHLRPDVFFSDTTTKIMAEHIGEMKYICGYTEFVNGNYVQIGYIAVPLYISRDEVIAEVDDFLSKLFVPYIIVLLLTVVISFFIARGLTRPLDELAEKMKHFRIGRADNRIHYTNNDEIGQLVDRYNEMVDELEISAERLARSEREGAWRTMARQIAHEINNPLTPMKLTIQQLQRTKGTDRFDDYFSRSAALLIEQIDNLSRIASSFSQFAKLPEVVVGEVDVAERLNSVIQLFRQNDNEVPIRYVGPLSDVFVLTDGDLIKQVFTNIIKNALQAIESKSDGDIIVMLKPYKDIADSNLKPMVEVSVSDNGGGIPQEVREKVFVPNFTTKSTGMGLGLAISKNIVEASGGSIGFTTSDNGTVFYVRLVSAKEK